MELKLVPFLLDLGIKVKQEELNMYKERGTDQTSVDCAFLSI